jgi:hypothetical protein
VENNELPADVALMWRLRETPRRGPKPSLTLDDIVAAGGAQAPEYRKHGAIPRWRSTGT